jgi:drug/metabolite transporter (DMT)-like permease
MRHPQGTRAGFALAIFSSASFSTSGALGKSLIDAGWSPAAAVLVRVAVAALVMAVPAALLMRGRWSQLRRSAGMTTAYGLICVAGCQLCYFEALRFLPVGVALMIEYLGSIGVVGWMWLRHGQRPRWLTLAGAAGALAGLALVLGVIGHSSLNLTGVAWALGAAFGLGAFFVIAAANTENLPPMVLASAGMGVGAVALAVTGAVGVLPLRFAFSTVTFAGHRVSWLVPVAGLSLVAAVIAYVAGIYGARLLGPRLASFTGLTEVLFAVLIAWALLGQLPTAGQLAGGALILAGIAAVRADELQHPPAAPAPVAAEAAPVAADAQPQRRVPARSGAASRSGGSRARR